MRGIAEQRDTAIHPLLSRLTVAQYQEIPIAAVADDALRARVDVLETMHHLVERDRLAGHCGGRCRRPLSFWPASAGGPARTGVLAVLPLALAPFIGYAVAQGLVLLCHKFLRDVTRWQQGQRGRVCTNA
jgi:hypothetical protein